MKRSFYIGGKKINVSVADDTSVVLLQESINEIPEVLMENISMVESGSMDLEVFDKSKDLIKSYKKSNCHIINNSGEFKESIENLKFNKKIKLSTPISIDGIIIGLVTNKLNVQLNQSYSEKKCESILKDLEIKTIFKLNFAKNLFYVEAPKWDDAMYASEELYENEHFVFAEPTIIENLNVDSNNKNNKENKIVNNSGMYLQEQWYIKNSGKNEGVAGADMNIPKAWNITKGENIKIAVIDIDFDVEHDDLKNSLLSQSIHYINDNEGNRPQYENDECKYYFQTHGTLCAGIISAKKNSKEGMNGIAPESKLLLIGCLEKGIGSQLEIAQAIDYALSYKDNNGDIGADIIVCNLGGKDYKPWILSDCLRLSLDNTITNEKKTKYTSVFWAANNSGRYNIELDQVVSHPNVIAVVSTNYNDQSSQTSYGDNVELSAPGQKIYTTAPNNTYNYAYGNSFAAPCAAGCAALVLSSTNNILSGQELRNILKNSAKKIELDKRTYINGHNDYVGYGRIDAYHSIKKAKKALKI
jgi:thermitase